MPHFLKNSATVTSLVGVVAGLLVLIAKEVSPVGALFFLPFSFGPLLVTAAIGAFCRGRTPQVILTVAAGAYMAWFAWLYMEIFFWHPDPQSPVALVFVGAYSLPILLPMWIAAVIIEVRRTNRANRASVTH